MPLSLAHLAVEVLANITSRLSGYHVLISLPGCGNRLLTAKLNAGGVTYVCYEHFRLPNRFISAIQLYRLDSIALLGINCPFEPMMRLILGLSPALRSLQVNTAYLAQLVQPPLGDELDEDCPMFATSSIHKPWIVSHTFPQLEVLHLSGQARLFDGGAAVRFLLGLPTTITDLDATPILSLIPIDVWKLLPSNLRRIGAISGSIPTTKHQKSLPALEDVTLVPMVKSHRPSTYTPKPGQEEWLPDTEIRNLVLPRHLKRLTLKTKFHADSMIVTPFPDTLTSLTWDMLTSQSRYTIGSVLALIPCSATSIHLNQFHFHVTDKLADSEVLPLYKVKSFYLNFTADSVNDKSEFDLYMFILRCISNVEDLFLSRHDAIKGLEPAHLSLLSSAPLVSLSAPLNGSSFHDGEGQYPARFLLTRLQKLHLDWLQYDESKFTFAAIPTSVTHLTIAKGSPSTTTMHLLPKNIQYLSMPLLKVEYDDNFESLFYPPILPPSSVTSSESDPSLDLAPVPDLRSLKLVSHVQLKSVYLPNSRRHFWLSPDVDISLGPAIPLFRHDELPSLPPTLTDLKLPWPRVPHLCTPLSDLLSAELLPHLTCLDLDLAIGPQLELGGFKSLLSLKIRGVLASSTSRCPPNLTKLHTATIETESFLPLPTSITDLKWESIGSVSQITHLKNLKSLDSAGIFIRNLDALQELPNTLEVLKVFLSSQDGSDACNATTLDGVGILFPNLRKLILAGSPSIDLIRRTCKALPAGTELECPDPWKLPSLAQLAEEAGYSHGQVVFEPGETLFKWIEDAMAKAYPRWKKRSRFTGFDSPEGWWPAFAPFLSESTKKLSFSDLVVDPLDVGAQVPPNLQTLVITSHEVRVPPLPLSLLTLSISNLEGLVSLPSGLTQLDLTLRRFDTGPPATAASLLPQTLTKLHCASRHIALPIMEALPPLLTVLDIPNYDLGSDQVRTLPPKLKFLRSSLYERDPRATFAALKERKIIYLIPPTDGMISDVLRPYLISSVCDYAIQRHIKR